jgi:nitrogenase subunit NifH
MMTAHALQIMEYWVSESNLETIDRISKSQNISESEVVRLAIEHYDPDNQLQHEFISLLHHHLAEAIYETRTCNEKIETVLNS